MAVKHKNLYLYLTLVCFIGIILIFVFDGYMGVYDTLIMDNGQYQQKVEADQWSQPEKYGYLTSTGVERGGRIEFTYSVENHRFSKYTDVVEVTLFYGQDKLADIVKESLAVSAFNKSELNWSLDSVKFVPSDYPAEQMYNLTMLIKRGETERKIMINISPSPYGIKVPIPAPAR